MQIYKTLKFICTFYNYLWTFEIQLSSIIHIRGTTSQAQISFRYIFIHIFDQGEYLPNRSRKKRIDLCRLSALLQHSGNFINRNAGFWACSLFSSAGIVHFFYDCKHIPGKLSVVKAQVRDMLRMDKYASVMYIYKNV